MQNNIKSVDSAPEFSVIITCYYEEKSIDEFYARLSAAMQSLNRSYEIIFVNDGSTDATFEHLKTIFNSDPNVTAVIDLFKNVGQAAAMVAGFTEAVGRNFIFMDSDLQLDPEDLPVLVEKFDEGADVVSGYRENRKDSLGRMLPSKIANIIMRKVSKSGIKDFGCNIKIFRAELIRAFNAGPSRSWSTVHVIAQAGRVEEVPVNHHPRKYGRSGWTFRKLFALNMDNLVRLSQRPFQILGIMCLVVAMLFILRVFVGMFRPFSVLGDITNGLLLNALIVGLLVLVSVLCIIGEFVIRNFLSLQKDPIYIVREIFRKQQQG